MSRQTRRNGLVISAALALVAVTACGGEPSGEIDRAAFQAELAPLSIDARAQAADVGRVVAGRALAGPHCVTLQPRVDLAAARNAQPERS